MLQRKETSTCCNTSRTATARGVWSCDCYTTVCSFLSSAFANHQDPSLFVAPLAAVAALAYTEEPTYTAAATALFSGVVVLVGIPRMLYQLSVRWLDTAVVQNPHDCCSWLRPDLRVAAMDASTGGKIRLQLWATYDVIG